MKTKTIYHNVDTQKDGGPVHPAVVESVSGLGEFATKIVTHHGGMTLRDYFAAKAMQVVMKEEFTSNLSWNEVAVVSFQMADAMLTAGGHNANDEQGKS